MTRQIWQYVLSASLCVGLLPGCTHSLFCLFDKNKVPDGRKEPATDGQVEVKKLAGADNDQRAGSRLENAVSPDSAYHPSSPVLLLRRPDGTIHKSVWPLTEAPLTSESPGAAEEAEPPHGHGPPSRLVKPANPPPAVALPQPEEPLVLALARLIKEDKADDRTLALLDRYDPVRRELFQRLLPVLATLNKRSVGQLLPEELAVVQDQLQALLLALRARAELVIDKICYCQPNADQPVRVKPLPEKHPFLARSGDRPGECVCVYVELRNLGTVRKGDFYETRISSSVEIRENGVQKYYRVFKDRPLRSPDVSGDFFNKYTFNMPANIPPGRYELLLEVRDETTKPERVVKRTLPFVVTADAVSGN